MQRDVITVGPDTPLAEVHALFVEQQTHGAPVVAADGHVIGVVSALDLLRGVRRPFGPHGSPDTTYFRDELLTADPDWHAMPAELRARLDKLTVAAVMTRDVVSVDPDASADAIAATMRAHRIHRVLVCSDATLQGVVTTYDLLRAIASQPTDPGASRSTGYRRGVF